MTNKKPTYQELEIQLAELKQQNENLLKLNQLANEDVEKYKNLVNHSPDIIYKFSNKRGGLFWSNSIKNILGFKPEDIINNPFIWNNLIHPEDKDIVQKAINDSEKAEDYNIEYRIQTKQGKWIWLHDSFIHKTVIDNEIIIEGHASDITARKEAEQKLKESKEHLLIAQQISKTGSWTYNIETDTFNGSSEALKMYGFSPNDGDVPVERIESCILEREWVHQALVDLITKEKEYNIEFVINPIDNSPQKTLSSIALLEKNSQGKPIKVLGFLQDITERKNADLIINKQNQELKKLNADKDRFITILAHDLKSPFNSILGFTRLLTTNIQKYDINKIEKFIHYINELTLSTFKLLENILTWVRANSGRIPYEPIEFRFADICNEVIENQKLTANAKGITVNCFSANEMIIFADKNMFNTVLRNLLSNSIKFTDKYGRIDIYAEKTNSNITITVSDNGIGIEPDTLSKLFDISEKITTDGTANEKGTGLGLLLCKEFVEKHKGKIWVESELGKGSDFKFTIPSTSQDSRPETY